MAAAAEHTPDTMCYMCRADAVVLPDTDDVVACPGADADHPCTIVVHAACLPVVQTRAHAMPLIKCPYGHELFPARGGRALVWRSVPRWDVGRCYIIFIVTFAEMFLWQWCGRFVPALIWVFATLGMCFGLLPLRPAHYYNEAVVTYMCLYFIGQSPLFGTEASFVAACACAAFKALFLHELEHHPVRVERVVLVGE